uniref:Uncharacterized protein n=1 Tax=Oryza rufipogon TaxID=4529 RepID=A0A0E0R7P6_ORYRU
MTRCSRRLLCSLFRGTVRRHPRRHDWDITYQFTSPDSVRKLAVTINGHTPSRTISVRLGGCWPSLAPTVASPLARGASPSDAIEECAVDATTAAVPLNVHGCGRFNAYFSRRLASCTLDGADVGFTTSPTTATRGGHTHSGAHIGLI